jgi:hypothetical protein
MATDDFLYKLLTNPRIGQQLSSYEFLKIVERYTRLKYLAGFTDKEAAERIAQHIIANHKHLKEEVEKCLSTQK